MSPESIPDRTSDQASDQNEDKPVISLKSARISVTIPEEMEEQLFLIGAVLGCKGKSDIIATAIRVLIHATQPTINAWVARKALTHDLSQQEVIKQAVELYKSSSKDELLS